MRDSYHREADTVSRNRIILTPRNVMNEVFKFYREHLYPITPIPSFRHCLMWALQSKPATDANEGLWRFNRQIEKPRKTSKINHRPCPQKTAVTSKAAR